MTSKSIQQLSETYLLPHLPDNWRHTRRLLYLAPAEWLLRGVLFDASDTAREGFYVVRFVQPLYIPFETFILTYGERLGSPVWWTIDRESEASDMASVREIVTGEARPRLDAVGGPGTFAESVASNGAAAPNASSLEAIAYGFVAARRDPEAERALGELRRRAKQLDFEIPWQSELARRTDEVAHAFGENPQAAVEVLSSWRDFTLEQLQESERVEIEASDSASLLK